MKAEWNASELRELHDMGFMYPREGDVYGTYSVVAWYRYNYYQMTYGGFVTEAEAQSFVRSRRNEKGVDYEVVYVDSLEEELAEYVASQQRQCVPYYTLDELMAFRDNPDTLAQAIEAIQTKQANIPIPKLITQWMEYEYARMEKVTP